MTKNITFLLYLTQIVYPKYNPACFIIYMIWKYLEVIKEQQLLGLQIVSNKRMREVLENEFVWDLNNTVVVNELGNEKCVKFLISADNNSIKRVVNVFSKRFDTGFVALINENLAHNINSVLSCSFKRYIEVLKFATEVELSLINTSNDWGNFVIDSCIRSYFLLPKLVSKGDIIEIDLLEYGQNAFFCTNKILDVSEKIYFKCNKITSSGCEVDGGYLCAVGKTTVKQTQNVQSFIPKKNHKSSLPSAFENYFNNIKQSAYPFISNKSKHDFLPIFLLEGHKGSGKSLLVHTLASYLGMHLVRVSNYDTCANVYAQNETKLRNVIFAAKMAAPTILEIKNFENFGKNMDGQYDERLIDNFKTEVENLFKRNTFPLILFCCSNQKTMPVELKRVFLKVFEIRAPNVQERASLMKWALQSNQVESSSTELVASKTHGFLFEDLRALVHYAVTEYRSDHKDFHIINTSLPETYLLNAVEFMQASYSESLGAPRVPNVRWSDIGGLSDVKSEIIKTIEVPLKHPEFLKNSRLKRSGILLYGPPGTGKTLIAKAVATECGLCFLSVKGPELLNMYVGQSEQNVREVFERAREASPCIIFFDELDSLAPNRGISGDSGGVMDRVVSQLLAEMDGLNRTGTIFVIGATNRPDLIDPALLRPGRFDKLLYVGPSIDKDSQVAVLEALTRRFNLEDKTVVQKAADLCSENFSGADFYGVCSNAWMRAARRAIQSLEDGTETDGNDVVVRADDFANAIHNFTPTKQQDVAFFQTLKS